MNDMLAGYLAVSTKPNSPAALKLYHPDAGTLKTIALGEPFVLELRPGESVEVRSELRDGKLMLIDTLGYQYEPTGLNGVPICTAPTMAEAAVA